MRENQNHIDFKITDYNYFGSTLGNAYFSGLTLEEIWSCVSLAENREQFDDAISITIKLKKIQKELS